MDWPGEPEAVVSALLHEGDVTAACITLTLVDHLTDADAEGWDGPPVVGAIIREGFDTRPIPGGQGTAVALEVRTLTPWDGVDGPGMADALTWVAAELAHPGNPVSAVLSKADLLGWMLMAEAWAIDSPTPDTDVAPSEHPDRIEIRVAYVVDRAGTRYMATHRRGGAIAVIVDRGREDEVRVEGRLADAVATLMEATP